MKISNGQKHPFLQNIITYFVFGASNDEVKCGMPTDYGCIFGTMIVCICIELPMEK